jgi:hypothetical protein
MRALGTWTTTSSPGTTRSRDTPARRRTSRHSSPAADVSPAMLAVLRKKAAAAGVANLEIVRAGFLSYDHAGPPADGVFTRNALH